MYMSIPFQIFCNMNTKNFQFWFLSHIHISKNDFRSYRKSIRFCVKWYCFCFSTFIVKLFFWNQYSNFFITTFTLCCKTLSSLLIINKLVSSTNKTNSVSFTFKGRSFLHILKTEEVKLLSPLALHVLVTL